MSLYNILHAGELFSYELLYYRTVSPSPYNVFRRDVVYPGLFAPCIQRLIASPACQQRIVTSLTLFLIVLVICDNNQAYNKLLKAAIYH